MKVAIIGYGIEGLVSAEYWKSKGDEITVCDLKTTLPIPENYQRKLGTVYLENLDQFDIIVRTAGLRPQLILDANPDHPEIAERITTSMNEFVQVCPSRKIIGITGTKGKGTTSTFVAKILQAAGLRAHLGGNIGIAPLEMLKEIQPDDWVVLEMSSFQLIDFTGRVPIAACLMMAPEHLNWHPDLEEYFTAKAQLFIHQRPGDTAIYNANSPGSVEVAANSPANKIAYDVPAEGRAPHFTDASYVRDGLVYYREHEIMLASEVKLLGRHNLENLCAAISIVWPLTGGNIDAIKEVATSFAGLEHHIEFVAAIDDVQYIDDSYSTMPDATVAAVAAIKQPKVLILGGVDKGIPLDPMITAVAQSSTKHVVLFGSMADAIQEMLAKAGFTAVSSPGNVMKDVVEDARKHAEPGDVVLLSPGCAAKGDGFFVDNKDRGNQFKEIVRSLAA